MPPIIHEYADTFGSMLVEHPEHEALGAGELVMLDFGRLRPEEEILLSIVTPPELQPFTRAGVRRLLQMTGVEGREVVRQLTAYGANVLRFTGHKLVAPNNLKKHYAGRHTPILFKQKSGPWVIGWCKPHRNETGPVALFLEDPLPRGEQPV
jgi:hypothetical protein